MNGYAVVVLHFRPISNVCSSSPTSAMPDMFPLSLTLSLSASNVKQNGFGCEKKKKQFTLHLSGSNRSRIR